MGFTPLYDLSSLGVLLGTVGGGNMTAGSPNLTTVGFTPLPGRLTADYFTGADVGRIVTVMGAGPGGRLLISTIVSVTDTQNVVLHDSASVSVTDGISNTTVFRPLLTMAGSIQYDGNLTDVSTASFSCAVSQPVEGQPFLLTSTDPSVADAYGTFFGGEIDTVEIDYDGYMDSGVKITVAKCTCVSYKAVLQRRVMLGAQYGGRTLQYIVTDIAARATADFIDVTSVVGPTIPEFTIDDYTYLDQAIDGAVNYANDGSTKYFWSVDHWRCIHVVTSTTTPAPWSVSTTGASDGNVLVKVSKTRSRDKLANQVYAKASKALGDPQNAFFPNAQTSPRRTITLPQAAGVTPEITVNSVTKSVWPSSIDPRNDSSTVTIPVGYDWAWPIDSDYLFCDSGRPGIPSAGAAVVTFRARTVAISTALNNTSLSQRSAIQGGSGLHEAVETVDPPMTKAELDAWVAGHVATFGLVPESVMLQSFRGGLTYGMGLTVHLPEIGATVNYLIESVQLVEDGGHVRWDVKASIGSILGDWTQALLRALGGDTTIGGGIGYLSTGSVLDAQFIGGSGIVSIPYAAKILVNGGQDPYGFTVPVGSTLPAGVSIDAVTGIFSGTPTASGAYDFTIKVIDTNGDFVVVACHVDVADAPSDGGAELIGTITSFTVADNTGARWSDGTGALHAVVDITISCNAYPKRVTLESVSPQYGRISHGWFTIPAASTVVSIGAIGSNTAIFPPTVADETVTFRGAVGTVDRNTSLTTLGLGNYVETTATVHAPGTYGNTGDSSATSPTVNYYKTIGGAYIYTVTFQVNLPLSDPKFWFWRLFLQTGTGTGGGFSAAGANAGNTAVGDWAGPTASVQDQQHADGFELDTNVAAGNIDVTLGPWNVPTDGINTLRLTSALATRKDDGSGGTKTLQYTWPSGAHFFDVVLDPVKAQIDATLLTTASIGSGLKKNISTSKLEVAYGSATMDDGGGNVTVRVAGPLFKDLSSALNLSTASDFIVSGGVLNQNFVNLAKATNFGSEFVVGGGVFAVNAIAVNKLAAGTALFTGTATFAYSSTGAAVQIGSAGAVMVDNYASPTATLTMNSSGMTVAKGSNSVSVSASSVTIAGPGGTITSSGSSMTITNGSNTVTIGSGSNTMSSQLTVASNTLINASGVFIANGAQLSVSAVVMINSSGQFVGAGVSCPLASGGSVTHSSGTFGINISTGSTSQAISINSGVAFMTSQTVSLNFGQASLSPSGLVLSFATVINSSLQFVGAGVFCPSYNVTCSSLTVGSGGINYNGSAGLSTGAFAFMKPDGSTGFLRWQNGGLVASTNF